jgi:uncharacterized FlaG/YvyC family protein
MNIRSVTNPVIATNEVRSSADAKSVKTDQSHQDRDADGRNQGNEPDKRPLTDEELKKAREYFDGLENLKANGLHLAVEDSESHVRLFVIRDQQGQVVRRIPEYELRQLVNDKDRKTGNILDRAG